MHFVPVADTDTRILFWMTFFVTDEVLPLNPSTAWCKEQAIVYVLSTATGLG